MSRATMAVSSLVSLLCAVATVTATAQGIRPHFGVGTGLTFPIDNYDFNRSWQGLALVELDRPQSPLGIRLDGMSEASSNLPSSPDLHTRLWGGSMDVIYVFQRSTRVRPYLLTGAGLYNLRLYSTGCGDCVDTSATKLSWNAGVGVRYHVSGRPITLFMEARYRSVGRLMNGDRHDYRFWDYSVMPKQLGITVGFRSGGL